MFAMPALKKPIDQKRVSIWGKVDPATRKFLDSLGEPNYARAIDRVVKMARQVPQPARAATARSVS